MSSSRHYRSQIAYSGPLGHGWDLAANARLVPAAGDVIHHDGSGRADLYVRTGPTTFSSAPGIYSLLIQNPDGSFTLRNPNGTLHDFHGFDGTNREGAAEKVTDRNGNFSSFLYDHQGLLTTVVDTMGRSIDYAYDAMGRIASITEFAGRQVQYGYDANGDLVSVRSPIVTGTPNGNDFPSGKVTKYTYSSGFADARLNHNLTGIIRPNEEMSGTPMVQIAYGSGAGGFDFDRVTTETIGGTNASAVPAGGSLSFLYESLNPGHPPDPITPRRMATVFDRNGNRKEFVHNAFGNLLTRTDFTNRDLRPGEQDYTTQFAYNTDGEMTEAILPEGNRLQVTYDTASPNRGSQGNPLEIRAVPDNPGGAGGGGGRGDGHGGTLSDRVWTFTYDDFFNGLLSITDPRGNDPAYIPQNGGAQSAARYTARFSYDFQEGDPATNGIEALSGRFGMDPSITPLGLGDLNGDGVTGQAGGNPVKRELPAVLLDPVSNQAGIEGDTSQEAVALYVWNGLGQLTAARDPEGNRHEYEYFPETDPDGDGVTVPPPDDGRPLNLSTGGYLRTVRADTTAAPGRDNGTDPTPAMIQHDFEYDDVGNVTGFIDGRGVLTRYVVNALNQVVEVRRAAATADLSGPDGDPPTGRGETSGIVPCAVPVGFKTRYFYDANDNVVRVDVEDRGATLGIGPFVETTFTHDLLDNILQVSRETTPTLSLVTQFRYDANENLVQVTEPEGNVHARAWDERDLLLSRTTGASGPRGGVPAVSMYEYDGNGNLIRITDPRGGLADLAHDGFDRLARTTDQIGNTGDSFYDPVSRMVRALRRGPIGGPTPADRSGTTNVDLADTRFLYDERGRLFRTDRSLFVPAGAAPARPPILAEGPLVPADGAVNTVFEHDRLSRLTFALRDSGAVTRYDYDGAGRRIKTTLPQGVEIREMTYDDGHNLVETVEKEFAQIGAGASIEERFFTTAFHDALGRPEVVVDNIGQTRRFEYDSLGAVVAASDARGPAGGMINRRSPGNEMMMVPVNSHGNVTNFTYDGAGRLLVATRVLTATGEGDGTLNPVPDDSNVVNPDGLITRTTVWDGNSLPLRSVDDRGNETIYAYDNLNRLVSWTGDDGTVYAYTYDPAGNLTGLTDPKGSMFTRTHDPAHRLTIVEVVPAPGVEGTTNQTLEYDGLGRLTRGTDENAPPPDDDVTASFVYDSLSRLVEEGLAIGPSGSLPLSTTYGWSAGDLMTDLVYPDGRNIRYGYDAADRLVSVDDLDPTRPEGATYEYFGLGRVHTRTSAGGPVSTRMNDAGDMDIGFDGVGRTTLLRHRDPATGTVLAGFEYRYSRESQPTSHRRLHHSDALGNLKGETYAYDSAGRLISFREGFLDTDHLLSPPPDDAIDWILDGTSNWPEMTRNGVTYLATPNNMNEYGEPKMGGMATDDGVPDDFHDDAATADPDGLNFANDENGDLTFDGRHDLFFDAFGRLVRAVRNAGPLGDPFQVASYTYDALGRRATRVVTNSGSLDESVSYRYGSAPGEYSPAEVWSPTSGSWPSLGVGGVGPSWGHPRRCDVHACDRGSRTIEEGSGGGAPVRQIVYGTGEALWQIRNTSGPGGPTVASEYFLEDPFGTTVALFSAGGGPGGGGGVVERVTYDPYGKPVLESPGNVPLTDVAGNFLPQSQYGNTHLWLGMEYEPELGERTADPNTDWGGLYAAGSDWKYVSVGRFQVFLEAGLFRGTEWAVFGPGGGGLPAEQFSLNFEQIKVGYKEQGTGGGTGKPKKGFYSFRRCDPNKGDCPHP